jgi:putative CocE/NonD family hydrolase
MSADTFIKPIVTLIVLTIFLYGSIRAGERTQDLQNKTDDSKVSEFGKYQGYSKEKFQRWVLASQYVEMRDGVKLAVDVIRPSSDGNEPTEEKVPVIWTHSRYHRNQQAMNPGLKSMVDGRPDLQRLVKHGYAVATVGVRGSGASFGRFEGLFSPSETKDSYEIINWLANQPWCNGNIGMFGGSYLGMTQYMAASQGHPALKAIFPDVAGFDLYEVMYPGGVFRQDMIQHWDILTRQLDTQMKAARVDTDKDGKMLAKAIEGHSDNWEVFKEYRKAKHRNTRSPEHSYFTHNPAPFLKAINQAKVPAYHWNGFHDVFVTDATLWYANYAGPQKLGIGSWGHSVFPDRRFIEERMRLMTIEQHRWFDHWLKGIDNGIMDEPPINYSVLNEEKKRGWKTAEQWPPKSSVNTTFYFASGKSGSIDSVNDGLLQLRRPRDGEPADKYKVDMTTTTGASSRWDNAVGQGPLSYGDLSDNDRKSLTYTTAPLKEDVTVTGHPVATLYISCAAEDCDFHVLLEEVNDKGKSSYVTEGVLRASNRTLAEAPWNNLGLPYQRCFKEDQTPLVKGRITELKLDLHPTSTVFNASHRIRVTIMCADKDNTESLKISEGVDVLLHHDPNHLFHIVLPIDKSK